MTKISVPANIDPQLIVNTRGYLLSAGSGYFNTRL